MDLQNYFKEGVGLDCRIQVKQFIPYITVGKGQYNN